MNGLKGFLFITNCPRMSRTCVHGTSYLGRRVFWRPGNPLKGVVRSFGGNGGRSLTIPFKGIT